MMSKKIKIEIKHKWHGSVLFSYESEDNTLLKTVSEANLRGANLRGANLYGAKDADFAIAMTRILPEGSIYGYKKCREDVIVKLRIPAKAKRSHAFGRKCRAEFAKVVAIYGADEARSSHDPNFTYRKGDTVRPTQPFDENWVDECSTGIHFFITREEAEKY